MGEIKSTRDIVMEKTKGLRITSGDKQRIRKGELNSRIQAIFRRYMDARGDQAYLKKEVEGRREDERDLVKRELLLRLLDAIDLSKDNDKAIAGIEALKEKPMTTVLEKLQLLASEFEASRDETIREIEGILRRRLAGMGISGSAVQPNLEGKGEWTEALKGLQRDYESRLQALKEELLNS